MCGRAVAWRGHRPSRELARGIERPYWCAQASAKRGPRGGRRYRARSPTGRRGSPPESLERLSDHAHLPAACAVTPAARPPRTPGRTPLRRGASRRRRGGAGQRGRHRRVVPTLSSGQKVSSSSSADAVPSERPQRPEGVGQRDAAVALQAFEGRLAVAHLVDVVALDADRRPPREHPRARRHGRRWRVLSGAVRTRPPGSWRAMKAMVREVGCAARASTVWYWSSSSRLEKVAWIAVWQSRQIVVVAFPRATGAPCDGRWGGSWGARRPGRVGEHVVWGFMGLRHPGREEGHESARRPRRRAPGRVGRSPTGGRCV